MRDFVWGCTTMFHFGKDALIHVGDALATQGATRVLIVYGGGSAVRNGIIGSVEESLDAAGIGHIAMGGVRPNPEVNQVRQGIVAAQNFQADFLLPVGGGSVIDCAKAISFGVFHQGDVWDFFEKKVGITKCLPIACVLTIPAAGSESSASCVISNDELRLKRGLGSELFRPRLAFLDPTLTFTLPPYQTAAGATDMIAHICERWFSGAEAVPVTDATAAGLIRTIMSQSAICLANPQDYNARANLMWAGTLAHNGLAGAGRNLVPSQRAGGWESHALEHELSALRPEIAHGAGLAVILPAWMRYVIDADPQRFADFASQVFGIQPEDDSSQAIKHAAHAGIDALQAFFASIGMPQTLDDLGICRSDIPALLETLRQNKGEVFGAFKKLGQEDARAIYLSAFAE